MAPTAAAASAEEDAAVRQYSKRLEEAKLAGTAEFLSYARRAEDLIKTQDKVASASPEVHSELMQDMARTSTKIPKAMLGGPWARHMHNLDLCQHCRLPLGGLVYTSEDDSNRRALLHGECMAQRMLTDLRTKEADRKHEEKKVKVSRRSEFDIGWKPKDVIPENAKAAVKLACDKIPQGMVCLVAEADSTIRVAPTFEPAAAVNLEYLSTALQVRMSEGTEPLFSLDPVDNGKETEDEADASMQVKRFEPEWLAGTAVGEVLFQADYHLKELSFGEYEQPVVGMKSCFDLSERDSEDSDWSAREWFVVRKAEMHISNDQVLVPYLKMGVEAREQIMGKDGLEDVATTRADHPLVMYADAFTHNFDLICERKSVVSQLREVAKASILAKFLLESGKALEESWFNLAGEPTPMCCLEVPQLWNDRAFLKMQVKDGIIDGDKALKVHGLYGGVDFGIDRFRLSQPSRVATSVVAGRAVLGKPASSLMATTRTGLSMAPARQFARLSAPLSATMSMAASRAGLGVPRVAAGLSMTTPQGVDLNLDKFNLSAAVEGSQWGCSLQAKDYDAKVGSSFFAGLSEPSLFSQEDRALLKRVFNPHLSDRADEGELFQPPPSSLSYLQKLRQLVKAEETVRQQRKELFFSDKFNIDAPGPVFPTSWSPSVALSVAQKVPEMSARPEYVTETEVLMPALKSATSLFDKTAEDGTRFRAYRVGALEVRTAQDHDGQEVVGMVLSTSQ